MKFAGTKRQQYTTDRVRKMRMERALVKAKKQGVSDEFVQSSLGKLQAAGHLSITGFQSMNTQNDEVVMENFWAKEMTVKFKSFNVKDMGDRPHLTGYLRSASEVDKQYRIKGWFNEDGTIRLELIN
jgi:hypothetical protein